MKTIVAIAPIALALTVAPLPVLAQISAAPDGTNTTVNQTGNTFNITGGTPAGTNQFHSFSQFGLNSGQTANFLSNPAIQTILARVTGGNASVIHGLIQVSGSNANLYLMNPAGIVFGANASLNVPGSFVATTASGIGIGSGWFHAIGSNNYATLVGTPNQFAFTGQQPATILNAGNLAVGQGKRITLLGGTVINTGTLTAPGGTVTIAAIPGEKLVRVSQNGSLLSLDLPLETRSALNPTRVTPVSLPALLTGGAVGNATGLTVENGVVKLTGSGRTVSTRAGDVTLSQTINVAGAIGGTVQVLGDRVNLTNATVNASGQMGGGTVLIGGDVRGQGELPTAKRTFVSADSLINASALERGNGGRVIVWAEEATGFLGQISATGGTIAGDGGFVEVSGKQTLTFDGIVDVTAAAGSNGQLLLDPETIEIGLAGTNDPQLLDGQILAGEGAGTPFTISAATLENQLGNVILEATNGITIADGVSLTFVPSTGTITFRADADSNGVGNFVMAPTATLNAPGRSLVISGASVSLGRISTFEVGPNTGSFGGGDDIRFPAGSGAFTVAATNTIQVQRIYAGNVALTSQNGNIITGAISSEDRFFGSGSQVVITAPNGTVLLQGVIRAGQTNKTTDSTIAITAARFQALNPFPIIESDIQGNRVNVNGIDQTLPMNLYAYPRDVDAAGNDTNGIRKVGTGQVTIGFGNQPLEGIGTGTPLITIRLLQDTSLAIGTVPATGSGSLGAIAIGAERAPSAIVLLRDNVFNASIDPVITTPTVATPVVPEPTSPAITPTAASSVATVLENQQNRGETAPDCDPTPTPTPILDFSAVTLIRGLAQEQTTTNPPGLDPCQPD